MRVGSLLLLLGPIVTTAAGCSGASTVFGGDAGGGSSSGSGGSSGGSSSGSGGSGSGSGSSSGGSGSSSGGSSSSSGGGNCSPTPPDGGSCNSLSAQGPIVPVVCSSNTMPTPVGGTIADGTYVLISETFYGQGCPQGEQDRNTWLVCGSVWQTVQELIQNGSTMANLYDINVTANGPSLQLQGTCGFTQSLTIQYDATPTTLTLYVGGGTGAGTGRVDVYQRQ